MNLIAEAQQADRISLLQRDVTRHEDAIHRVIKQGDSLRFIRHHATAIEHENQTLALVGLKVLDGQAIATRRRPPFDMSKIIVHRVITESFELIVLTNAPRASYTHLPQSIRASQERVFP